MHRCHMVDAHKRDDVTRPCALGFRRLEESSKSCSSPSARAIFTHTWTASIYCLAHRDALSVWRHALGALSESERIKSEKDELYLFLSLLLSLDSLEAANAFSAWIWRERNIFDPFRRIFNMLCYILLPLTHNKLILVSANNLREIID